MLLPLPGLGVQACELLANQPDGRCEALAIRRDVEPAACAGGMGKRDDGSPVQLVPLADARRERRKAEQTAEREPADGDDQLRPQQLELPVAPEGAELLLPGRRRPVAAARRSTARVA